MSQPPPLVRVSKKLSIEFNAIKQVIDEVYISVGMITDHMYDVVSRAIANAKTVSIVAGIHMATSPKVLDKLKEKADRNELKAGLFVEKYFHPKLYLFKVKEAWIAFVGSGNFTDGGWFDNEELFVTVTDQDACKALFEQHILWFEKSKPLTDDLLNLYRETYFANSVKEKEKRKNVNDLIDNVQHKFNIDYIDFADQYFTKEDHLAFQPGKTHLDTDQILKERTKVRHKLYQLNDKIKAVLPNAWDLHDHYATEHVVANIETLHHHESNVRGLWLAYGRGYDDLKKYGDKDTTPLNFMRMQVIVQYKTIGFWLMPGKLGGSRIDREYFQQQIEQVSYMQAFYALLHGLGEPYWIEIADEIRSVTSFDSPEALKNFLINDNWRYYYFNIGINYQIGSSQLKSGIIVNTIMQNFSKFLPLYNMIKDNFLTNNE